MPQEESGSGSPAAHNLNPHESAPPVLRKLYKDFKSLPLADIDGHPGILDLHALHPADSQQHLPAKIRLIDSAVSADKYAAAFETFVNAGRDADEERWRCDAAAVASIRAYEHQDVPGLHIFPSLLPPEVQRALLSRLVHRDLVVEEHKTNLHMHYAMTYPKNKENDTINASFFTDDPARKILPKDSTIHNPLSISQLLTKKLRWVTLGGQYDWTAKTYPGTAPPAFPPDIAALVQGLFPAIKPEAAIVNFYSPGDVLSVHRDVSEECDVPLLSVSIGDDALFLIGHEDADGGEIVRLRSGDAVCMSGASRFAWHAVPKIVPGTCPEWLREWPGGEGGCEGCEGWKGWMGGKRVNLNIRQMKMP